MPRTVNEQNAKLLQTDSKMQSCQGWILQPVCAWSTSKRLEITSQVKTWMRGLELKDCAFCNLTMHLENKDHCNTARRKLWEIHPSAIDCASSRLCYSLHELIKIGEKTITILLSMYFKRVLLLVLSSILKTVHNCLVFPTYNIGDSILSTTELQTTSLAEVL